MQKLVLFHTPLSLNCVVPTLLRFLTSVLLGWCRHFFAFLFRFHLCGADTFSFLTPFSLAWCRHFFLLRFLMSFSPVSCRHFFAFLRRFYLRGADSSPLFYAVLTCVVRCFSFLRRFHLCSADTCSLSYVVFTYVAQTLVRFFTSFSPM